MKRLFGLYYANILCILAEVNIVLLFLTKNTSQQEVSMDALHGPLLQGGVHPFSVFFEDRRLKNRRSRTTL